MKFHILAAIFAPVNGATALAVAHQQGSATESSTIAENIFDEDEDVSILSFRC